MYLLNLFDEFINAFYKSFTFHYVSIKSFGFNATVDYSLPIYIPLVRFTFHYVSIKSIGQLEHKQDIHKFTFHYVSIKSTPPSLCISDNCIYIPLCIY